MPRCSVLTVLIILKFSCHTCTNYTQQNETYPEPIINHDKAIQREMREEMEYSYNNTQLVLH